MRRMVWVCCWVVMALGLSARAQAQTQGQGQGQAQAQTQGQTQAQTHAQALDERGWTVLSAGEDARLVYVSSSDGSDTNSGLFPDQAKRTLAGGRALLRDGMPDRLLLRRGDTWDEPLRGWNKGGRGPGEPMVITSYGRSDERPTLRVDDGHAFSRWVGGGDDADVSHLALVGIRFETRSKDGGVSGFWWHGAGLDLLIEDCVFDGGANGIVLQKAGGRVVGVRIRRCVIVDVGARFGHSQGLYAWGVDGLMVEGCVFDGGSAPADPLRRQIFIGTDNSGVTIRGNLIARSPGDGVLLASGGVIEGNVFVRCPRALMLGGGAYDPVTHTYGVTGVVRGNVVLDCDDGIAAENIGARGAVIEDNTLVRASGVAIRLGERALDARTPILGVGCQNVLVRRNIVYAFGVGVRIAGGAPGRAQRGHVVEANQIVGAGGEDAVLAELGSSARGQAEFSGNVYGGVSDQSMVIDGQAVSLNEWSRMVGEADALGSEPAYSAPGRSLATYNAALGGGGTIEAFLKEARRQSRLRWREGYTPGAARAYIREGFRIEPGGRAAAP